ncbi:unnamed protein product [Brachionus calyciflorus]|uniref:Multifunctional fusion protein n=1 Tax=Brachionus calyciflorus TaxID=104777 RepID=A0A813LYN7_9BILA|nr:unnamed protein product [Brachionus calyciflorus]
MNSKIYKINGIISNYLRTKSIRSLSFNLNNYVATNEPIFDYKKNSPEAVKLHATLKEFLSNKKENCDALFDVPIVIGDSEFRTQNAQYQVVPFDHKTKLARFYHADKNLINDAIKNSLSVRAEWENSSFEYRAGIFLKAADKISNEKRAEILAATMLGQGKTVFQAEIDAACELADFLRFNVQFLSEHLKYKPLDVADHTKNNMELRGLEGFVAAVAPFNFTAIGGNLSTAPALMGNVVVWKPSDTAVLSSYLVYKILRECGLPAGVINFVPSLGPDFGETITQSENLAAINFTGSVPTFRWLWKKVGENLETYKTFPRLSGECGGKNFHLIHESADIESAAVATVRSAFEYSGQKCSACSRLYVPESKWPQMKEKMSALIKELQIDTPLKFETFTSAVIDERSFDKIANYIEYGRDSAKLVFGGFYNKTNGYYVYPTMFETKDPKDKLMREEIFGPVLTVYKYKDNEYDQIINLVDTTTPYALTGSIFAKDENILKMTKTRLRQACGNLYINDKSTGAVVNQQPFGGARLSGTNDKPGGPGYLLKWASPLSVKEFLLPQSTVKHASML